MLGVVSQQCCVRLHGAKSLTGFKLCATTSNNVQQGEQTDATCNIQQFGSCWSTMLRPFARSLIRPALQPVRRRCTICSHVCVIRVILFLALIKTFQLILHKGLFIWYQTEFRSRVYFLLHSLNNSNWMTARDENVTQKENSRCFKLHRPHSNSLICQMLAIFSGDEF